MKTPKGTSVGVDDPYAFVERCDHLTSDGRCRYAVEQAERDPEFARERQADDLRCPAADPHGEWEWADCPHFRSRQRNRECLRCGLEERTVPGEARPLLEEHHLSYRGSEGDQREPSEERAGRSEATTREQGPEADMAHEITVYLCRWCHAKVHSSWARVDDDVGPDPEAIAAAEERRSREQAEAAFSTAAERFDPKEE